MYSLVHITHTALASTFGLNESDPPLVLPKFHSLLNAIHSNLEHLHGSGGELPLDQALHQAVDESVLSMKCPVLQTLSCLGAVGLNSHYSHM